MTELKPRIKQILIFSLSFLISFGCILFIINTIIKSPDKIISTQAIVGVLIFVIVILPPLILSATYFYTDLKKKVFIDENNKQIIIKTNQNEKIISKHDIIEAYYVCVDRYRFTRFKFPFYKYILLVLKDREMIFITNLLIDPESMINQLSLNCKIVYTNFPFLNKMLGNGVLTKKQQRIKALEFEDKVFEFEHQFQNHSISELQNIINQKSDYADYAVEAAKRILNRNN